MFNIGYAQEIITPPVGVGLAGYMNKRPNVGMYDDLYVKVIMIEAKEKLCGFVSKNGKGYIIATIQLKKGETFRISINNRHAPILRIQLLYQVQFCTAGNNQRRKAEGCGGKDSVEWGIGHN